MGHVDGGNSQLVLYFLDHLAHLHAELGVQVAQGFIHQQDAWLDGQGAGQRHALLLPAGKPLGKPVLIFFDFHQTQKLLRPFFYLILRQFPVLETEGNVLFHGQMRENRIVLEHHADVALFWRQIVNLLVVEIKVSALNGVESGDHSQ